MTRFVGAWITCAVLMAAAVAAWPENSWGADRAGNPDTVRSELERMGFVVQDGVLDFPKIVDMCCSCHLPTCFANNPSSPYGIFVLPPAPDQDPAVPNPYSEWFTEDGTYPDGWSWFWRLRPDEAVVFIGTTPPRMKYFGFTAYLYDRHRPGINPPQCISEEHPPRDAPPSAIDRFPLFASLGDTTNNLVVNVGSEAEDPFLEDVVVIFAADANVEARVREALRKGGYPGAITNTLVGSQDIAHFGVDRGADTFTVVLRVASNLNRRLQDYIDTPKTLLRVSPQQPVPASELVPLRLPRLRVRGTGTTETSLLPAVNELGRAIVAAYPNFTPKPVLTTNWSEGYNCIENGQNCLGDNRDTPYIPPSFNPVTNALNQDLLLGDDEFLVAYGVNHAATRKAVYSNIAVLGWRHKASPVVVSNDQMPGSASWFLGPSFDPDTADQLYAWKIARPGGCTGSDTPSCIEVDSGCSSGVAEDEPLAIVFRAYLERSTQVGPAYNEIVIDRVLKFSPPQP